MATEPRIFRFDVVPKQGLFEGHFERTAIRLDHGMATINWLKPGLPRFEPHSHPFDQLAFVLKGTMMMVIEGRKYLIEAGQAAYIPPGVLHTGFPIGGETVLNIDVFAPAREDYLSFRACLTV